MSSSENVTPQDDLDAYFADDNQLFWEYQWQNEPQQIFIDDQQEFFKESLFDDLEEPVTIVEVQSQKETQQPKKAALPPVQKQIQKQRPMTRATAKKAQKA